MAYPCEECTTVEDTKGCNRKECGAWKHWFLDEWKKFNNFYERYMKEQVQEDGT
jgi:hypothetical protein